MTPALSYHRFHLDTTNPAGFWRALVDGDCPGIRPAEILWNGAHGAMTALDNAVDVGDRDDAVDRAECLLKATASRRSHRARVLGERPARPGSAGRQRELFRLEGSVS